MTVAMPFFQARFNAGANLNTSVIFSLYTVCVSSMR